MDAPQLQMHIAMYPWLAMGHITTYLHLANKLAKRRHRISFFIPKRTKAKVEHYNLYPHLITFIPITIPHVDGLPPQAETTFDVPLSLATLFMTAMDRTKKDIEPLLHELKPNVVFFDFALWIPSLARSLGIKSLQYITVNVMSVAFIESMKKQCQQNNLVEDDEMNLMNSPPAGFPDSSIKLHAHEVRGLASFMKLEVGGVSFMDHVCTGANLSDAVGFRGCREIEGQYAEFLESFYWKPLLLSGPGLPDPPNSTLEQKWAQWLARFNPALKAPIGFESVEEAMPEGFKERVHGRGIVHGVWNVQQTLILDHPSIGCFITHCGASSLLEALVNKCQLVMLPNVLDQIFNARMMSSSFKAGVEVEKGEEDGLFTKESVCKAVKTVMDDESEVGRQVRENHLKLRNILSSKDLENTYNDSFCHKLQELLGG
uniref:Anthocyanidin 3-O-glucosyltransferase n=1 Tax=Cajanus cajan TaxID=3821 RepID=A0A151QSX4_CAJCA|nr:Anthocyanidin 3-O-glucosyltransferase [Cajanus cajan]